MSGAVNDNRVRLNSTAGFYVGAWVEIDQGNDKRYRQVLSIDGPVLVLDGTAMTNAMVTFPMPQLLLPVSDVGSVCAD